MSQDKVLTQLKKDVRSLLISSKLGVDPQQLCEDYFQMLGHPMPLKMLGYTNVMHFVNDVPDVVSVNVTPDRHVYLKAVCDETTREQAALVTKQRLSKANRSCQRRSYGSFPTPSRHSQPPPSGAFHGKFCSSTFIPPDLRTQLHHLLSRGPIRSVDLEWKYMQCFGFPLCVRDYGFRTKDDMLLAASDTIVLQRDQCGWTLTLKQPRLPTPLQAPPRSTRKTGARKPLAVDAPSLKGGCADVKSPVDDGALQRRFSRKGVDLHDKSTTPMAGSGAAGATSQDLKDRLRKIVRLESGGLSVSDLTVEKQRLFGEALPVEQRGFVTVGDLIDNKSDIFHVEPAGGRNTNQWIVSDKHGINTKAALKDMESFNDGAQFNPDCPANPEITKMPEGTDAVLEGHLPTVPMDAVLSQRLRPPTRHPARELIEVSVEEVLSPGQFYIRFIFSDESKAFEEMMIDMRRCYRCCEVSEQYCLPEQFVRVGQVCCLSPAGWWFYRAVLHQVLSSTQVEVYYVDFGIMATVQTTKLKFLKSCYSALPAQGVPSSLAGTTPTNGYWTADAVASFRELCIDRVLVGLLDHYVGDVLQLYLCDTSTAEDIYSHNVLISQGHGKACNPAVSAALSPRVTPVSCYLGKGVVDLPEVQVKKTLTPQPWESKEEEVDMPSLELIK